jgi:tetratricopeptide (TPR) repeat protein
MEPEPFKLKPLNNSAIGSAMEKANHYRLLNDPENAGNICLDILDHDPENQPALVTLILSLADQFSSRSSTLKEARSYLARLDGEYFQAYYGGLVCERAARAMLKRTNPGVKFAAYDLFREAMEHFEKAESLSSDDNDDAVLRWKSCVRTINKRNLESRPDDNYVAYGD